jgi:hypothetical protein
MITFFASRWIDHLDRLAVIYQVQNGIPKATFFVALGGSFLEIIHPKFVHFHSFSLTVVTGDHP